MRPTRLVYLVVALLLLSAGCATVPSVAPRPVEHALQDLGDTPLSRIASASLPSEPSGWSGFRLIVAGESAFNARIALARRATRSLDVQYFLLAGDETGRGFLRELRDAAQRGVRVRLLLDDLHASAEDDLLAGLAAYPNVQVRLFNPLPVRGDHLGARLLLSLHELARINHRMHNKLFIADNVFAISGGRNVADEYFMNSAEANFLDLDLLSSGPVVRALSAVFDEYWNSDRAYAIEQLVPQPPPPPEAARASFDAAVADATVRLGERQRDWLGNVSLLREFRHGAMTLVHAPARVLADGPDKADAGNHARASPSVAAQALDLLAATREQALIMSPYFVPGQRGMQIIRSLGAAAANARVTLLTNSFGSTDSPLAYAGYTRYRLDLLKAGVRVHELSPTLVRDSGRVAAFGPSIGRLHSKMLVIDRRWLFIGSMNLDPRSVHVNTEGGLVIDSPELAMQADQVFRRGARAGAYQLRLTADQAHIEWVETDWQGRETVHADEPHDNRWLRLKLGLLGLFVSEDLL